jgi:hypothetical protein
MKQAYAGCYNEFVLFTSLLTGFYVVKLRTVYNKKIRKNFWLLNLHLQFKISLFLMRGLKNSALCERTSV